MGSPKDLQEDLEYNIMERLKKINSLLPDNDSAEISEQDIRDAFKLTFDEIDASIDDLNDETHGAINSLDSKKLSKTTITIPAPTAEFKYAYLTNEANETRRMLAGDLGKNVANAALTSVTGAGLRQGANWEHNTSGYYYYLKGLPNKYTDQTFDKKIVIDANGQVAISEREDITVNIPDTFTSGYSLNTTTISVNHIYPEAIPERPAFANEIQTIMANYKNINFIPITQTNWTLWTKDNKGLEANTVGPDGSFSISGNHADFRDNSIEGVVVTLTSNIILPQNKNWILKLKISRLESGYQGGFIYAGVARNSEDNIINYGIQPGNYASVAPISYATLGERPQRQNFLALLIKSGNVISVLVYGQDKCCWQVHNAFPELGDYIPKIVINKTQGAIYGSMSYKILN